jgi:cell division septum initiation protein DivIVA
MAKKSEQLTLDELRDKSVKSKTKLSFGKEMSGYNKKQVTEYIDNLSENLRSAEESFNNRLEEYVAMITMLKQERDQYGEMYNLCKSSKVEMSNQIDELKRENEQLNQVINEQNVNQNPIRSEPFISDPHEAVVESQKKLEEYLSYEQESQEMKAQLDQLKTMVRELNNELETYAKENLTGHDSGNAAVTQTQVADDVLKRQYDDILRERKALLTEKNRLTDENNKLAETVDDLNERLKSTNQIWDARIQELNSNAEAFIKNIQENQVQLTVNMKNSLNLIKAEEDDLLNIKKLMHGDNNDQR